MMYTHSKARGHWAEMGAAGQLRRLMLARNRNFAPASLTTILVFFVTLGWLLLADRPRTDPKASAFALGYYLTGCATFEGRPAANRFANETVRLASRLRIPTKVFPGQPDQRKQDACYDSAIAHQIANQLTATVEGYFILGQATALHETFSQESSPLEKERLDTMMHDIIGKLGSANKSEAVSSFCAGLLNADQLYSRLFGAKDHLIGRTPDFDEKGVR